MSETEQDRPEPAQEQTGMTFSLKDIVFLGQVVGTLLLFASGVTAWNGIHSSIGEIKTDIATKWDARSTWVTNHEQLHKDRLAEVSKRDGAVDARLENLAVQIRELDELRFRVGAAEQSQKIVVEAVAKLQTAVNDQSADLRVIRQILEQQLGQRAAPKAR